MEKEELEQEIVDPESREETTPKRKYTARPTQKHRKALKFLVENGSTLKEAMIQAGYSPNTAIAPTKMTKSQGFMILCEEVGLTDELIAKALVEDIQKKPQNRKGELELASKVKGLITNQNENKNLNLNFSLSDLFDSSLDEQ